MEVKTHRAKYNGREYDLSVNQWAMMISITRHKIRSWLGKGQTMQEVVDCRRDLNAGKKVKKPIPKAELPKELWGAFVFSGSGFESYERIGR